MYMGYSLHANRYITKPVNLEKFLEVVREIETFWLSVVRVDEDSASPPDERIA
jgi:hypothetical protein